MNASVRKTTLFVVSAAGFAACLWGISWLVRPQLSRRPFPYTTDQIEGAQIARNVNFDPAHPSTIYRHEVVHPTGQSPILADLERQGDLPPLAQRMPIEPVVMQGKDGIGVYGGTWMRLAPSLADVNTIGTRLSGAYLVHWSPLGYPIEPHIAKSVTPSPDKTQWTVELRPGLRWSDGEPFTADDILYWWNAEANNKAVSTTPPQWMSIGGKVGQIEKIDDFHVRFRFDKPYALFLEQLAGATDPTNTPAHYLRKYHPDPAIGDATLVKREQTAYQMPSPLALYRYLKLFDNPEHPRLWPWVYRKYKSGSPQVYVRNPCYFVVDPAGNQLPYIDRLQFDVQDEAVLAMSAANGSASMQDRNIRYSDYTELMSRRGIAGTRVLHWYPATRSPYVINPNLNRIVDPKDATTKWKAQLLSDKRFRQALSLAINRRAIIRADYNDQCEPEQVSPGPQSPFANERLAKAFTEFDPQRAGNTLDEIGLTQRDEEGFRTCPDGARLSFNFDYTVFTGAGPAEFVVDDWAAVGIRAVIRERSAQLFQIEKDGLNFDFHIWSGESDYMPLLMPRYFIAATTECHYAVGWGRWFSRGGFYGDPAANVNGCIAVPRDSPMYEAMGNYEAALQAPNLDEQKRLMGRVTDIAADNLWTINICTSPPALVVVKDDLRNVPDNALVGFVFATPANTGIETYFFAHPQDSAGAIEETRQSLLHPVLRPGGSAAVKAKTDAGALAAILRALPVTICLILLVWLGVRYPFLGRRLAIMVPTLLIISLIVFTIIQLPPGDFLTTRIAQLEESGDAYSIRQIEDLRLLFHFEDPAWKKYVRWMGLRWFVSFKSDDAGLLQGNLGRSMDSTRPVNEILGDRLMFTVLISLGTILFTWAMAIPIGIYSAVRQYSLGDYALTLIGFVGMCVPSFLLALVLMAVSGVSGLFSPEFAAQPEWNWPKVLNLLSHIWIPVIVLGIGGTAGMIRVMRANLLDELRRPYVITAMAKGVRPLKLLLKYPVRMSLNPFISGIGGLFPQLISGGAIVSVVLSLPTIGPLMIDALRSQDMYLAGSLLMVLNVLAVFGTLVSDLLLLWLDPRIRFQGGTR